MDADRVDMLSTRVMRAEQRRILAREASKATSEPRKLETDPEPDRPSSRTILDSVLRLLDFPTHRSSAHNAASRSYPTRAYDFLEDFPTAVPADISLQLFGSRSLIHASPVSKKHVHSLHAGNLGNGPLTAGRASRFRWIIQEPWAIASRSGHKSELPDASVSIPGRLS